jgi:periplasmic divalent cation tolerance protein
MLTNYQLALITTPDRKTADSIAGELLSLHLAACVTVVNGVSSMYWWENAIRTAEEVLLIVKTKATLMPEILLAVKARHPYKVPEIISFQIADGNPAYLDWLGANTKFTAVPETGMEIKKANPPISDKRVP